jgi:hypothetical protein
MVIQRCGGGMVKKFTTTCRNVLTLHAITALVAQARLHPQHNLHRQEALPAQLHALSAMLPTLAQVASRSPLCGTSEEECLDSALLAPPTPPPMMSAPLPSISAQLVRVVQRAVD